MDGKKVELQCFEKDSETLKFIVTNLPSMKARYYARNLRMGNIGYPQYTFPTF